MLQLKQTKIKSQWLKATGVFFFTHATYSLPVGRRGLPSHWEGYAG